LRLFLRDSSHTATVNTKRPHIVVNDISLKLAKYLLNPKVFRITITDCNVVDVTHQQRCQTTDLFVS